MGCLLPFGERPSLKVTATRQVCPFGSVHLAGACAYALPQAIGWWGVVVWDRCDLLRAEDRPTGALSVHLWAPQSTPADTDLLGQEIYLFIFFYSMCHGIKSKHRAVWAMKCIKSKATEVLLHTFCFLSRAALEHKFPQREAFAVDSMARRCNDMSYGIGYQK